MYFYPTLWQIAKLVAGLFFEGLRSGSGGGVSAAIFRKVSGVPATKLWLQLCGVGGA